LIKHKRSNCVVSHRFPTSVNTKRRLRMTRAVGGLAVAPATAVAAA
jgi:hypothetical protein